jgi:hypothetical protein
LLLWCITFHGELKTEKTKKKASHFPFSLFSHSTNTIMSTKGNLLFKQDQNVLCFHGPLLYEAKVSEYD